MKKIVYCGSPEFAVKPLEKLVEKGYDVIAVISNEDKPVGRKQILTPTAVKQRALELGLPVYTYKSIRKQGVEDLKNLAPDIVVTCAFGQILSQELLDIPSLTLNIHGSILPKYRGAAPIEKAVIDGEKTTGITIMRTDAGIDTGDMLFSREIAIGETETAGELAERLSVLGAECIIDALEMIKSGNYAFTKQDESKATYVKTFSREDAKIDFTKPSKAVVNHIRGFNPRPIAFTVYHGEPLKIFSASAVDGNGNAGEIISDTEFIVACGDGAIKILELQKAGGKKMQAPDFLRGNKLIKGEILG